MLLLRTELKFFLPALGVTAADQLSKFWVRSSLGLGESVPVLGPVRLSHVANPGAAFGLLAHPLFLALLSLAVVLLLVLSYRQPVFDGWLMRPALGIVLGGGVGNLIDRLRYGFVTDFVDFRVWPVFNLADSAIVVGSLLLVYLLLVGQK